MNYNSNELVPELFQPSVGSAAKQIENTIDPEGKLAEKSVAFRCDELGQKAVVLDPALTVKVSDDLRGTYNPFDELDASDPYTATAAQAIASGIVMPDPQAETSFLDDTARDFIQACILYMVRHYSPSLRTLPKLRETVAIGDKELYDLYVQLKRKEDPDFAGSRKESYKMLLNEMLDTHNFEGVVSETAAKIGRMDETVWQNVYSTAIAHLNFVKSPELWDALQSNPDPSRTFRLRELRRQDRPLTVYLCLPPDMIPRYGRWFRLIISGIAQFIEYSEFDSSRDYPILMMIDEPFQLIR